jgi:hypothetical protein
VAYLTTSAERLKINHVFHPAAGSILFPCKDIYVLRKRLTRKQILSTNKYNTRGFKRRENCCKGENM